MNKNGMANKNISASVIYSLDCSQQISTIGEKFLR